MKIELNVLACLMITLGAPHLAAAKPAETLTLTNAIDQAQSKNAEIRRLGAVVERTRWGKLGAAAGFLPKFEVGFDHKFDLNYPHQGVLLNGSAINFPVAQPQDALSLNASWTVFDGLASWYGYQAADLETQAARLELSRARFAVEQAVRTKYFGALAAQRLLEVAEQNVKTLENHLELAKMGERAGYSTQFHILRIGATLEGARAEREGAVSDVQITREALQETMGLEGTGDVQLTGELPVFDADSVPQNIELQVSSREDYRAQLLRDQAKTKLSHAAHAFWYPTISLYVENQYYRYGNFEPVILEDVRYKNSNNVGVRLRWNLFDGGHSYAKQREAAASAAEAAAETQKQVVRLPKEFDTWKRKFFYNVSLYRAHLRAQEQYQESVRLAEVGLKAGSRTHTEALDAELDLFRARGGVVRAQVEAVTALSQLELAVGHNLTVR